MRSQARHTESYLMPKSGIKSDTIKKALLKALEQSLGVVTTACKKCNITRKTYYVYLAEDKDFAESVSDIQNIALDFAESKLHKSISEDNLTAVIFYLKTKGKCRGYIEKSEIEQSGTVKVIGITTEF